MKINKNRRYIILFSAVVVISLVAAMLIHSNLSVLINEKYSFSEVSETNYSLTSDEKKNLNTLLDSLFVEDNNYFGFTSASNTSVNLYTANSLVNLAKIVPNSDMDLIKEKLGFLSTINEQSLDFLNLIYYVELSRNLGFNIDYTQINNKLLSFYDSEINLFFVDNIDDSIHAKIIATSMVKKAMQNSLSAEMFSLEDGIQNLLNEYSFTTDSEATFYNSGGDILYCISVFGMSDIVNKDELNDWFSYWKEIYENTVINSDISALQYSNFFDIARIFEHDYSAHKLQEYYDNKLEYSINETGDLLVLYNILKNVNLNNSEVNIELEHEITKILTDDAFIIPNIDVKATVFGVILAKKTDFAISESKLNNYIKNNYSTISSLDNNFEKTYTLYYNLILDQLANGYEQEYDKSYFQTQIDNIISDLDFSQSILSDVVSIRRIVEIVSDLQLFDVDVRLTISQKEKIEKGMMSALDNDTITNSILLNDVFIIDKILSLNLVTNDEFLKQYYSLTDNGGTYAIRDSNSAPDICSTYQFMISLSRLGNYDELVKQKEFVEELKMSNGVYALDKNSTYRTDLSALVYGNSIHYLVIGGDKDA